MSSKQQKKKISQRATALSQREPRTGLLSLLAVAGAIVGFAWWRKHQQAKSQKPRKTQETRSSFRFPQTGRGNKTQNNKKKKGKERREEIKARQNTRKGEKSSKEAGDGKDDKEKDPLVLNYSYFVPERADKLSTPAQRMTLPTKQGEKQ